MTNCGPGSRQDSTNSSRTLLGCHPKRSAMPAQTPAIIRPVRGLDRELVVVVMTPLSVRRARLTSVTTLIPTLRSPGRTRMSAAAEPVVAGQADLAAAGHEVRDGRQHPRGGRAVQHWRAFRVRRHWGRASCSGCGILLLSRHGTVYTVCTMMAGMYSLTTPATGDLIEEIPNATDEEIQDAIERVHRGYAAWRRRSVTERARIVSRAAELFAERADELAGSMTLEMGKRINEGRGEIGIVVDIFNYYADNGPELLADEPMEVKGGSAVIVKQPIGPLLGVMPWNFPCYQVARFVAPNLVLGNTIMLKHASICPRSM